MISHNIIKNKLISNSLWLIVDKCFLLIGGLIVTAMVARYLGPEQLGKISFGVTLSVLCTIISQWGASYTIFNMSSKNEMKTLVTIRSTFLPRLLFYILTWFTLSIYLFFSLEFRDALLVSLICLSNVFLGIDIYQFYLNGSLKSKLNATASMKAKLLSMSFRTIFVLLGLNVWWFIIPLLVEGLVIYSLKHRAIINDIHNIETEKSEVRKEYYSIGRLFFLSSLLVYIYSKSNEIFLKEISSFEDVGIYSIGVVLSASWIFVPLSIGTSFLTHANKKNKDELYTLTYFVMFMSSVPILLFIYMLSGPIVDLILGDKYMELIDILPIMAVSSFFSCLGFITNRYVSVLDSSGRYILNKVAITAFLSVFLTYFLVSHYGLIGAVISLLVIEFSNVTIGNYFYGKGKIFRVQMEILLFKRNIDLLFKTLKS